MCVCVARERERERRERERERERERRERDYTYRFPITSDASSTRTRSVSPCTTDSRSLAALSTSDFCLRKSYWWSRTVPGVGDVVESALRVTCSWCWIMREAARVSGSILTTSTSRPCRAHLKPCRTSSMVLPVWRKQRWDSVSAPVFVPVLQYNHCSTEYPPPPAPPPPPPPHCRMCVQACKNIVYAG